MSSSPASASFFVYQKSEQRIQFDITRDSIHTDFAYAIQRAKSGDRVGSPPVNIIPLYFFDTNSSIIFCPLS